MADLAELGIRYRAEGQEQVKQANRDIVSTGKQAEVQTKRIGVATDQMGKQVQAGATRATRSMDAVAVASTRAARSFDFRGPMMQVSQIVQQTAAGGDVMRAVAIQAADIGLYFGAIGTAAGMAATLLIPMAAGLFNVGDSAKDAQDAVDAYTDAVERTRAAVDLAGTSIEGLTRRYGEHAEAARAAAVIEAQIAAAAAKREAGAALAAYQGVNAAYQDRIRLYEQSLAAEYKIQVAMEAGLATEEQLLVQREASATLAADIEETTGRTVSQNMELVGLLKEMEAAMASGTISSEFRAAAEQALELAQASGGLDTELEDVLRKAIDLELTEAELARLMDIVAGGAANVASNISRAADEARRFASNMTLQYGVYADTRSDPTAQMTPQERMIAGYQQYGQSRVAADRLAQIDAADAARRAALRGGGGRSGGGGGGVDPLLAEAERVFRDTRTAAEEYATELERINKLHDGGYIDAETYVRALDDADEKFRQASEAGSEFAEMNDLIKDGIMSLAREGVAGLDNLIDRLAEAALQAALFGEGPLGGLFQKAFGLGAGGIVGGILPSFAGGGYTGDSPRSGGLDGKGGFLAMMHPQEWVQDGAGSGGSSKVQVEVFVNDDGTLGAIARTAGAAAGAKAAPGAVAADIARNGVTSRAMQGVFGARKQLAGRG